MTYYNDASNPKILRIAVLIAVALLLIFAVTRIGGCIASMGNNQSSEVTAGEEGSVMSAPEAFVAANLPEDLDETSREALIETALDPCVQYLAANLDRFEQLDEDTMIKLYKLAAADPAARPYVVGFLDNYGSEQVGSYDEEVVKGEYPHLLQWDSRWGYYIYTGNALGLTGCAPTTVCMAYMGLSGDSSKTPVDFAELSVDYGYAMAEGGTYADFVPFALEYYGYSVDSYYSVTAEDLYGWLEDGNIIIANMGPGDFTDVGHFILVTGIADADAKTVNVLDPYSIARTDKTWDISVISEQCVSIYVVSD